MENVDAPDKHKETRFEIFSLLYSDLLEDEEKFHGFLE